MACYSNFGDNSCATCEDVYPGPAPAPDLATPIPGTTVNVDVSTAAPGIVCHSRWWLWLAIGVGLGYLAND
jgi:hypothetical protein